MSPAIRALLARPLLALTALLAALTAPAAAKDALTWLAQGIDMPSDVHHAGTWHPHGGEIFATDPLTLWQTGSDVETLAVPDAPARVVGLLDREQGRAAAMALIWSDADVVCGADLSTIGVDTGLAGFMTPADVAALTAYGDPSAGLYHGTYAQQLDAVVPTVPFLAALPDGARFPVSGSGWGDGGYPVASLFDANGDMVALYVHFMGGGETWLLPDPCAAASS